jgi:hypothetical protein
VERARIGLLIRDKLGKALVDTAPPSAPCISLAFVSGGQAKPAVGTQTFNADAHFPNLSTSSSLGQSLLDYVLKVTFSQILTPKGDASIPGCAVSISVVKECSI